MKQIKAVVLGLLILGSSLVGCVHSSNFNVIYSEKGRPKGQDMTYVYINPKRVPYMRANSYDTILKIIIVNRESEYPDPNNMPPYIYNRR